MKLSVEQSTQRLALALDALIRRRATVVGETSYRTSPDRKLLPLYDLDQKHLSIRFDLSINPELGWLERNKLCAARSAPKPFDPSRSRLPAAITTKVVGDITRTDQEHSCKIAKVHVAALAPPPDGRFERQCGDRL
jgi:hypothetical protein